MKNEKTLAIGTRGSALALKQADIVSEALKTSDPSIITEVKIIKTHGDEHQKDPIPLDTIGKGWFTKEIEVELLEGTIDLAVHSLKDMAGDMPQELVVEAYLPREDARDVLVTKHGEPLEKLRKGAVVGTDSIRRQVQMKALRPDVVMKSIRGNVPNRIEKMATDGYDAVILAAAGLIRLGLEKKIAHYFEPDEMTPAPGQGIVAVQIKKGNVWLKEALDKINGADAAQAAKIERSFSETMGGGCKSPVGAYAVREGDECRLVGMVATEDGSRIFRQEMRAAWNKSADIGTKLAKQLLKELHGKA